MALCTNCGAILNNADIEKHICDPVNIPVKGKEKIPDTKEKPVI